MIKNFLLLCLIFLSVTYSQGQNSIQEIDIQTICKNHVESMGGDDVLNKLNTVIISQAVIVNNLEGSQKQIYILNKAYYQKTMFPASEMEVAVNDNKGWMVNTYASNKRRVLSESEVKSYLVTSRYLSPLYNLYIKGDDSYVKDIEIIRRDVNIEDKNCFELKVKYKSGFEEHIFISDETFLIKRLKNAYGTLTFSNYRYVDGLSIPFFVEILNSQGKMLLENLSVEINKEINYDIFK